LSIALNSLHKILEMESKKGFPDTTVIGGLDKFLQLWMIQIKSSPQIHFAPALAKLGSPRTAYSVMNAVQRKEWATAMLKALGMLEKSDIIKPSAAPEPFKVASPTKVASPVDAKIYPPNFGYLSDSRQGH
jgi:hypothetical protein